jgi:hypothetical protein
MVNSDLPLGLKGEGALDPGFGGSVPSSRFRKVASLREHVNYINSLPLLSCYEP